MDDAQRSRLAALTNEQVLALCDGKSGKYWLEITQALSDFGVDGDLISEHIDDVDSLQQFLKNDLEIVNPKPIITKQLRKLLLKSTTADATASATVTPTVSASVSAPASAPAVGVGTPNGAIVAAAGANAANGEQPAQQRLVSLRVLSLIHI